jgi:hypothetical protein
MAQTLALVVLILMLLAGVSLASRSFLQQTQPPGVVVTPSVAISDSPGASSASGYHLTGGTKVNVIDQVGDWIRLDTPQGAGESWVPAAAVESVS